MFNRATTAWFRLIGGRPCFRIYGRGRREPDWRVIEVHATTRRNRDSRWPAVLFRGTCITWTATVIAVGWDFAEEVVREQISEPASREHPVEVQGGRLRDLERRTAAGALPFSSASEVLAHECGHTWQALRLSWVYLPIGACFTFFREGQRWFNHFENQASEQGLFGGIVSGSVDAQLWERASSINPPPE
jgi:hypothetical protein